MKVMLLSKPSRPRTLWGGAAPRSGLIGPIFPGRSHFPHRLRLHSLQAQAPTRPELIDRFARSPDYKQIREYGNQRSRFKECLEDRPTYRSRDLERRLVSFDLGDEFALRDGVPLLFYPPADDALFNGVAELRHLYRCCHYLQPSINFQPISQNWLSVRCVAP